MNIQPYIICADIAIEIADPTFKKHHSAQPGSQAAKEFGPRAARGELPGTAPAEDATVSTGYNPGKTLRGEEQAVKKQEKSVNFDRATDQSPVKVAFEEEELPQPDLKLQEPSEAVSEYTVEGSDDESSEEEDDLGQPEMELKTKSEVYAEYLEEHKRAQEESGSEEESEEEEESESEESPEK